MIARVEVPLWPIQAYPVLCGRCGTSFYGSRGEVFSYKAHDIQTFIAIVLTIHISFLNYQNGSLH